MTLGIAFEYGERTEILEAVRRLIAEAITTENINEKLFSNYLYTVGLPNVASLFVPRRTTYQQLHAMASRL